MKSPKNISIELDDFMAKAKIEILLSLSSGCMWQLGCLLMESQASQCLGHG